MEALRAPPRHLWAPTRTVDTYYILYRDMLEIRLVGGRKENGIELGQACSALQLKATLASRQLISRTGHRQPILSTMSSMSCPFF